MDEEEIEEMRWSSISLLNRYSLFAILITLVGACSKNGMECMMFIKGGMTSMEYMLFME